MTACPSHPEAESVGACARCGRFYCAAEQVELDGKRYCGDCGARDDVDWLGKHYRKLEGQRSGLAWFLLVAGLTIALAGGSLIVNAEHGWQDRFTGLGLLVYGLAAASTITGKRPLRWALLVGSLMAGALFTLAVQDYWGVLAMVPLLGLAAAAWTDVRTQLFFRVPVPRETLRKHYQREGSNPLAITASRLAFLGLLIPGVGVLALVLGVMAASRVDAKAVPPVGNLSAALTAIAFSLFTSLMWGLTLF